MSIPGRCGPPATCCAAGCSSRKRGEFFAHIQNTNTQYNLPALEERVRKTKDQKSATRIVASQDGLQAWVTVKRLGLPAKSFASLPFSPEVVLAQ
jgi:hypothetical protein